MGNHHHHDHTPHHDHGHDGHHHHHTTGNIKVAFWLNLIFCILEFAGGFFTNSIAILSDALHDLGDSFSLGLAWYFQKISQRKRDKLFSYGYKRFSLLGALINSMILLVGSVFIAMEAIPRMLHPESSNAKGMIIFALIGIAVNGAAVLRLKKGSSVNERVISLHLIEDVLGWVAVLIAAVVMLFVDIPILDPILSLLITGYILFNVVKNLKHSLTILLQAVPIDINELELKNKLLSIPSILDVHDIHIWTMDGDYNISSVHIVLEEHTSLEEAENIKLKARKIFQELRVHHITIETESPAQACSLQDC
ncbi:MAG: Cobalt-zinc-cadmium efflux system protein [Chitinophagaceae bacterium]|nr:Cobalt-zinc-cadmium efflux system protein [Chitinophagaceae bacterium]